MKEIKIAVPGNNITKPTENTPSQLNKRKRFN